MAEADWEYLFVVYRVDNWRVQAASSPSALEESIVIKEALPSEGEAEFEVERLNRLNSDKECSYFYQQARFYPDGRKSLNGAKD